MIQTVTAVEEKERIDVPHDYRLGQNYPNPFNPSTTVDFDMAGNSLVSIVIYDLLGKKVKTLVSAQYEPGSYHATWDGTSDSGFAVAAGVYIYRMKSEGFQYVRKMILSK